MLGCYRYIEWNPVHAGRVEHPAEYPWSSYRANRQGEVCSVLQPHACYRALGVDEGARQAAYRKLFRYPLDPGLVEQIREATNGNYALGTSRFQDQVARALGRRVSRGRSGRPKKPVDTATDNPSMAN